MLGDVDGDMLEDFSGIVLGRAEGKELIKLLGTIVKLSFDTDLSLGWFDGA